MADLVYPSQTPLDKDIPCLVTLSDSDIAFAGGISASPIGAVIVVVNGLQVSIGNGTSDKYCYFTDPNNTTPKAFSTLNAGDVLRWNGSIAGYQLAMSIAVPTRLPSCWACLVMLSTNVSN